MNTIDMARVQLEHNKEFWAASHRMIIDLHKLWLRSQMIEFGYRMTVLLVGSVFGYMGYRLFLVAGARSVASLSAGSGPMSLSLTNAAPGTFFALFGTAMIIVGLWKLLPLPQAAQPSVDLPTPSLNIEPVSAAEDDSGEPPQ